MNIKLTIIGLICLFVILTSTLLIGYNHGKKDIYQKFLNQTIECQNYCKESCITEVGSIYNIKREKTNDYALIHCKDGLIFFSTEGE